MSERRPTIWTRTPGRTCALSGLLLDHAPAGQNSGVLDLVRRRHILATPGTGSTDGSTG